MTGFRGDTKQRVDSRVSRTLSRSSKETAKVYLVLAIDEL